MFYDNMILLWIKQYHICTLQEQEQEQEQWLGRAWCTTT
ncbi:hypothetical protein TMEC50S_00650 [Thauera mechernichensis]